LLSLELERRHALNTAQRRERAQVFDRLARGTVDDAVAARWLASVGLPDSDLRVAVVSAAEDADELAADLLITLPDSLVRVVGGDQVELAVPLDTDLPSVLATLATGHAAGIGIGVRPGALVVSLRQARSALPSSLERGRHVHAEIASSRLLLTAVGPPSLQAYADALLGPLDAADRAGELLEALSAFLEHNGHWAAAATALKVHRHTLRSRIDAVERLTGRLMDSAQDRHELWLALRARDAAGYRVKPPDDTAD
jgi:purine catabolism regulator